ncbi:MAG: DUF262 domain-containing protein [Bacteroidetes bacterium]|nr:DUF262 domain-containing protein [Bacteroidota bacterium]
MEKTTKAIEFKDVFQNSLKINARSMSVKTLLSERNLSRINYSPYYQRNYVWDTPKQTFFIESVILGTEIPPLILFKSGTSIEVIDGRQRFETLKRFKENNLTLSIDGLKELQILSKKSFNKLNEEIKEIFLNSNIRIYEFEVINQPNLSVDIIDRIKKEIFRRYNTGITPLTREELDNAKYDEDSFSDSFKNEFKTNILFLKQFNNCFTSNNSEEILHSNNNDGIIAKNVDFIRRFRILNTFPISTYAGSERTEIIDLLYDFANNNCENPEEEFNTFLALIKEVILIHYDLSKYQLLNNKLIYSCILWALSIIKKEGKDFKYDSEKFKKHYSENINKYSEDNSHYYRSIIDRYTDTALFFQKLTGINFSIYLKDEQFKKKINDLKQTEVDAAKSIEELSNLRLNKPNPISIPIDEIRNDLKTTRYLLRPSYQRQEKINEIKASAIIESILLGISLPPIFIYKNENNIKEVVDGQQRLLAIISFLGDQFYNEDGKLTFSKNNNFKLKGLKILTDLEGKNFSSLQPNQKDKLLDFVIDLIIIEHSVNENFDPVDLFIRLNYKPYPIKANSFEMWNSIVNFQVIKKIREEIVDNEGFKPWFYYREKIEGKPDRMENEEMVTILSFICYNNLNRPNEEIIGFFPRQDRITCRLKNKKYLGDYLLNLDNNEYEKELFLNSIEKTKTIINYFSILFDNAPTKEKINEFLNVKYNPTFRRSLQDFYVIWLVLDNVCSEKVLENKNDLKADIKLLLELLKNSNNETVNVQYFESFKKRLKETQLKYQKKDIDCSN